MKNLLLEIKNNYCSICDVGSPSLLIGYKSSGTSLDYAFKHLKIPVAYAWEIYTNEKILPEMSESFSKNRFSFLQKKSNYKKYSKALIKDLMYNASRKSFTIQENEICFSLFNPLDKKTYDFIINNWTKVRVIILYIILY